MRTGRTIESQTASHVLEHKEDLTHLLILRFQQMLSDGVLTPGTKLPPERELAAFFKVARSSLRQALKVLEILGVITQKVGDGSYLNPDASSVLAVPMEFLFLLDDTTVEELSEFRFIIEPALAAKAADRANAADIALLRQSVADLESSRGDSLKLVASDLLFHRAIFQAAGNRLTGRLFYTIHNAMLNMITMTSKLVDIEHTAAFHKTILGAIERRDPEAASRLMTAHLIDATALLVQGRQRERERALRVHMTSNPSKLEKNASAVPERNARQSARFLRLRPSPGKISNAR